MTGRYLLPSPAIKKIEDYKETPSTTSRKSTANRVKALPIATKKEYNK